jgi:hypothetical protein
LKETIRQLDIKDAAKFEAKVKAGAQDSLLDLELRTPGSAFRSDLETAITEVLESAVTRALELSPNLTKEELIVFVDIFYEDIKIQLELDLGSDAEVFNNLPQEIKDNITDGKYPSFEEIDRPKVKEKSWWDRFMKGDDDISFD